MCKDMSMDASKFLKYLRDGVFLSNPQEALYNSKNELEKSIGRYLKFTKGSSAEEKGEGRCRCGSGEIKRWLFFYIDDPFQETPLIFIGDKREGNNIFLSPLYADFLLYDLGFFTTVKNPKEKFHIVWTGESDPMEGIDEGEFARWWFTEPSYETGHQSERIPDWFYKNLKSHLLNEIKQKREIKGLHIEDDKEVYNSTFADDEVKKVIELLEVKSNSGCDPIKKTKKFIESASDMLKNPKLLIVDILWKDVGKHGLHLIREVRRYTRNWPFPPPIIVYTRYSYPELISRCFQIGVDFVVFKSMPASRHGHRVSSGDLLRSSVILLWLILWYAETIRLLREHVEVLDRMWEGKERGRELETVQHCISSFLGLEDTIWHPEGHEDLVVELTPNRIELDKLPFSLRSHFPHLFRFVHALRMKSNFPEALQDNINIRYEDELRGKALCKRNT